MPPIPILMVPSDGLGGPAMDRREVGVAVDVSGRPSPPAVDSPAWVLVSSGSIPSNILPRTQTTPVVADSLVKRSVGDLLFRQSHR